MNRVVIEHWYDQPIHCPFCGTASALEIGVVHCDHWLYTAYDSFLHRSKRVCEALGLDPEWTDEADLTLDEIKKYGTNYEIIEKIRPKFFNLVEFDLPTPSDGSLFGFAPLDRELVYWGNDHVSPYEAIHK